MRVIVTRPAHSGERTARKLIARGHEPVLLPLTRPIYDMEAARAALAAAQGAIAITSAEAMRAIEGLGAELERHLHRPLFAVGKVSEKEAARIGFTNRLHAHGDGTELADLVAANRSLLGASQLTYLAGSPRAAGFEARLADLHIPFRTVECYRMIDTEPDTAALTPSLLGGQASAVLLYSRHTAKRFFDLPILRQQASSLGDMRFLCLSGAIADALPPAARDRAEIAPLPNEDSLLALLGDN